MSYDEEGFYTAVICRNGHDTTSALELLPHYDAKFCSKCGAATIKACPKCQTPIRGQSRGGFGSRYHVPAFCTGCGGPYPWTEERLKAAHELIELTDIPSDEKTALQGDLIAISADTPRTAVAATKIKRFLGKIGPELTGAMREILVDLATEAAKKVMFPGA